MCTASEFNCFLLFQELTDAKKIVKHPKQYFFLMKFKGSFQIRFVSFLCGEK